MGKRRKDAESRSTLFRECDICGQGIVTQADTPWMRQVNVTEDGKRRQLTKYYCSSSCLKASYRNIGWYDGKAEERRNEKDKARDPVQRAIASKLYYEAHREEICRKKRERYREQKNETHRSIAKTNDENSVRDKRLKKNLRRKVLREQRIQHGLCRDCGKENDRAGLTVCSACAEIRKRQRPGTQEKKDRGLCARCLQKNDRPDRAVCSFCAKQQSIREKEQRRIRSGAQECSASGEARA